MRLTEARRAVELVRRVTDARQRVEQARLRVNVVDVEHRGGVSTLSASSCTVAYANISSSVSPASTRPRRTGAASRSATSTGLMPASLRSVITRSSHATMRPPAPVPRSMPKVIATSFSSAALFAWHACRPPSLRAAASSLLRSALAAPAISAVTKSASLA